MTDQSLNKGLSSNSPSYLYCTIVRDILKQGQELQSKILNYEESLVLSWFYQVKIIYTPTKLWLRQAPNNSTISNCQPHNNWVNELTICDKHTKSMFQLSPWIPRIHFQHLTVKLTTSIDITKYQPWQFLTNSMKILWKWLKMVSSVYLRMQNLQYIYNLRVLWVDRNEYIYQSHLLALEGTACSCLDPRRQAALWSYVLLTALLLRYVEYHTVV